MFVKTKNRKEVNNNIDCIGFSIESILILCKLRIVSVASMRHTKTTAKITDNQYKSGGIENIWIIFE
jgi:hypothetical protein